MASSLWKTRSRASCRELKDSGYQSATVRHLLDMTVGLDFDEASDDPDEDIGRYDSALGWSAPRPGAAGTMRAALAGLRPRGDHGLAMQYASPNTDVIGWMPHESGE